MTKTYSLGVYVARWQGHHRAEQQLLSQALDLCESVLVLLGSAGHSRDLYHPFDEAEREALIRAAVHPSQEGRLRFASVEDRCDNARWNAAVLRTIEEHTPSPNLAWFVGRNDPALRYYRESFPPCELVEVDVTVTVPLDTYALAQAYFSASDAVQLEQALRDTVPLRALQLLASWQQNSPGWQALRKELAVIEDYRRKYNAPYYLTADAVVQCKGHVLLIRRGGVIGNGLWALPGGFVDAGEMFFAASLRELEEETGLHLELPRAHAMMRGLQTAEHPLRSPRARLVSQAYHFDLGDIELPSVAGSDDAELARWVPLTQLRALLPQMFEDHATVLDQFFDVYGRG